MYHQIEFNSDGFGNDILNYRGASFPKRHFHCVAELIYMEKGSLTLQCGESTQVLEEGKCALILPWYIHSFECEKDSSFWVHTFRTSEVPEFFSLVSGFYAKSAVFECDREALAYYKSTCLHLPPHLDLTENDKLYIQSHLPNGISKLKLKAALYGVLSCYLDGVQLVKEDKGDRELFFAVMDYIAQNFSSDITLKSAAQSVGYEYHYLSRILKRTMKIPFCELVNSFRIDHAKSLLEDTELSIISISAESGFGCLRTFNRVFLETVGVPPSEYRRLHS